MNSEENVIRQIYKTTYEMMLEDVAIYNIYLCLDNDLLIYIKDFDK